MTPIRKYDKRTPLDSLTRWVDRVDEGEARGQNLAAWAWAAASGGLEREIQG
jgi:hypothetical protein